MPAITLPDGSQRKYDKPVTVMEVAGRLGFENLAILTVKAER